MRNEKQICLSVPEELFNMIKQAAEEEYMSANALIRTAVVKYLREREKVNNDNNN